MNKFILSALIGALSFTAYADDPEIRTLGRISVTHCKTDSIAVPVVIISPMYNLDGSPITPDAEYEGDPLPEGTSCITTDSRVTNNQFEGELIIWGSPISQILYTASVRDGGKAYHIADWARTTGHTPNGAQYNVQSTLALNEDNTAREYDITFMRRAPDEQLVNVEDIDYVVPNYDRATILTIQRETDDGVLIFTLDYRDE
jgi:hypothetical protein